MVGLERLPGAVQIEQDRCLGGKRGGGLEGRKRFVSRDGLVKPPRPLQEPRTRFDGIRIIRFERQRTVVEREGGGVPAETDVDQPRQIASEGIAAGDLWAGCEALQRLFLTLCLQKRQRLPNDMLNVRL